MSIGFSELSQVIFPNIVARASPDLARRLVVAAGLAYFALNRQERARVEASVIELVRDPERAARVRGSVVSHIAEHYFEKLFVAARPLPALKNFLRERVEARDLSPLDEALSLGRGVIAVTTHWGAVEFIPAFLADRGYPVSIVLEAKTKRLRAALERAARNVDVELLIASRGDRVLAGIFSALERGRILVTQVDEVDAWRRRPSRTIRLFGSTLYFDYSLDFIAKRSRAPSVGLFCAREGGLRYSLDCEPIALDPQTADVAALALALWERRTLERPEQWYQWKKWPLMKAQSAAQGAV